MSQQTFNLSIEDIVKPLATKIRKFNVNLNWLFDKYDTDKRISFSNKFRTNTKVTVEILVDTDDHWGKVLTGNTIIENGVFNYNIPSLSFVTMTFEM